MSATGPVPPDEGRAALATVLASDAFRSAPRLAQFLRFVVERSIELPGDPPGERTIAVEALGRPATFDPRSDPVVRVVANRTRRALDRYHELEGASDRVRIDVPRGGYRAVITFQGDGAGADTGGRRGPWPRLAVMTFVEFGPARPVTQPAPGFTEGLVTRLGHMPGCTVVGPLAPSNPGGSEYAPAEAGEAFDATFAVHGSVRPGDQFRRVAVRLTEVATGVTIWSQLFDQAGTALAVEDRVLDEIAGTIADYCGVVHRRALASPERPHQGAYDALLAYCSWLTDLDPAHHHEAEVALRREIGSGPPSAVLMAMLAELILFGGPVGAPARRTNLDEARELARRAVASDPDCAHARTSLAFAELSGGNPAAAIEELAQARQRAHGHPTITYLCGAGLALAGDWTGGIELIRRSVALNPAHPGWQHLLLALDAIARGASEEALAEARRVDTRGQTWGPITRAAARSQAGEFEAARAELDAAGIAVGDLGPDRPEIREIGLLPAPVTTALVAAFARLTG
jgi:TolB-like protein/Flp pilus assembly protein TadD